MRRRSGTNHVAGFTRGSRTSCLGTRTPQRLKCRRMAAQACNRIVTSSLNCGDASGAAAAVWRCARRANQLVSLPATPRKRQVGSLTLKSQARRHALGFRSFARRAVSSRLLWAPQDSQSHQYFLTVASHSSSGSATSCSMCVESACTRCTTGCATVQPP